MGTFLGHFVPGLSLALLGLWHLINTIRSCCLKGSDTFVTRFWYPFPKLKHLELISILFFSLLAMLLLILDFPSFSFTFKPDNFEHASMFLHLTIFVGFTLLFEFIQSSDVFLGFISLLAASVFGQELFLLHFHSTDHTGLEGHYHFLLQIVVFASFASALASTIHPKSFSSALVLSMSVLFQGCWFLNMGFVLWVPKYVPRGCVSTKAADSGRGDTVHGAVACESLAAEFRAKAMANLQFSWTLAAILIFTGCLCIKFSGKFVLPKLQFSGYERLCRRGGDCSIAMESQSKSDQR